MAELDLVVRGGTLVDGTGAPGRRADVGVRDGRVVAVGAVAERGDAEIDARGLVVTPGFVDLHSHYDAQLFWDPWCTPSSQHGVTSVMSGNCGFTLAPVADGDEAWLLRLLANVEGMPLDALERGVAFDWHGIPELLDAVEARGVGVNIGLMAGHASIRRAVMGAAASERAATDAERAAMVSVLDAALAAGALGLSTATVATQVDGDGRLTPPNFAADEELVELAAVCGRHEGTCIEFTPGSYLRGFDEHDTLLMARMSAAADRHVNWNPVLVNKVDPEVHRRQLDACERARALGGWVVPMVAPQNALMQHDFLDAYIFRALPGWGDVFSLPVPERMAALRDRPTRERLRAALEAETTGLAATLRANWGRYVVNEIPDQRMRPLVGRSVADLAAERGTTPFDTILDVALEGGLDVGFTRAPYDYADEWTRATRAEVLRDPRVLLGCSDAGAHLDMMVGGDFTTRALQELVREQQLFTLEELVHRMADVPARLYGLRGRGRVVPGAWADLVVLDPDTVGPGPLRTVGDLPNGAERLVTDAVGVPHVVVNGRPVVRDGALAGDAPGRLLRAGRDTATVPARGAPRSLSDLPAA